MIAAYLEQEQASAEIEVFAENWDAVQVFQLCQWEVLPTMARPHYLGMRSTEIESVCRALDVRFDGELLIQVRVLTHEGASILNEE